MGATNSSSKKRLERLEGEKNKEEAIKLAIGQLIHKAKPLPQLASACNDIMHKEPHKPFKINASSLLSVMELSHQITSDHILRHSFQANSSIYSTALLYSNKEIEVNSRFIPSILTKPTASNFLNTSLTRDYPNITIRSNYQAKTSLSVTDETEHFDPRLRNASHTIKKHSSCEDLNIFNHKKRILKEKPGEVEVTIGVLDDKASIGKEYKESIVIQEENENLAYDVLLNRNHLRVLKANKPKGGRLLNKTDRLKNTLTFSRMIRMNNRLGNNGYRLVNKGMYINDSDQIDASFNAKERCLTLPHESSFCHFLLENMCNINEQDELIEKEKKEKSTKRAKATFEKDKVSYKLSINAIKRVLPANSKSKQLKGVKPLKQQVHHRRFISIIEHLMEIDPSNRSTLIKSKIHKQHNHPFSYKARLNELKTDTSSREEEIDTITNSALKSEDYSKDQKPNRFNHHIASSAFLSTEPTPKSTLASNRKYN